MDKLLHKTIVAKKLMKNYLVQQTLQLLHATQVIRLLLLTKIEYFKEMYFCHQYDLTKIITRVGKASIN